MNRHMHKKGKILVTGGLGFIGSHTVVELIQAGYDVVIVDDLSNAEYFIIDRIEMITGVRPSFFEVDVTNSDDVINVFQKEGPIDVVIHFAAYKAVGESYSQPLKYYRNNLVSLITVLDVMKRFECKHIVFSSSATVYGEPDQLPVQENAIFKRALSAYGSTKQMCEEMIEKVTLAEDIDAISLRYFNPVGAHASGLLGELPKGVPNNLMPFITQVAVGLRKELVVYGDDYPTADGSCIRDYIHVVDLAKAHVKSCDKLLSEMKLRGYNTFNIATGNGISVLELISAFEEYNAVKVNYKIGQRRSGDTASLYADATLANTVLEWKAELDIKEMVMSAWNWQQKLIKEQHQSTTT